MAERKTRVLTCRCDVLDGPGHRYCAVHDRASTLPRSAAADRTVRLVRAGPATGRCAVIDALQTLSVVLLGLVVWQQNRTIWRLSFRIKMLQGRIEQDEVSHLQLVEETRQAFKAFEEWSRHVQ